MENYRINHYIKAKQVRLVFNSKQVGVLPTSKALIMAKDAKLDLVEFSPGDIPVCKIIDFGKFKYEQKIKQKERNKKQKDVSSVLKELRLRPSIEAHDVETKISQAKKFLEKRFKVQFNLMFKGQRELSHKEKGFSTMNKIVESLKDFCIVEKHPKLEGNRIICVLVPK